jgi:transcription initiation factor TFIIB
MQRTSIIRCICSSPNERQLIVTDPECGEVICSKCGLVSPDGIVESRAEWRTFNSEDSERARTGFPISLAQHDMGLSTIIGKENKDSSGRQLTSSVSTTIQRLRTWDFRSKSYSSADRNLILAFAELGRLKDKLGLSDAIIEKTAYLYRKAQERGLIRGRSTSALLAAAIYTSCREMGMPRTLKDIAAAAVVKRKDISRSYRILVWELDIKVPLVDSVKCIAKIANQAGISEKTKRAAITFMNVLIEKNISAGKLPMGLAAAVLYISCLKNDENKTQKDIAEVAGVTEVTVRNRLNDLKSKIQLNLS